MEENDGKNDGRPSEKTERRASAYPAVDYFLRAIEGTPQQRANQAVKLILEFFPPNSPVTSSAISALETFCTKNGLDIDALNLPTSPNPAVT